MSRLRLIAGPNGSGKSSIFRLIKEFKENQKVINTGPFVNSDLIDKEFGDTGKLDLKQFGIESSTSLIDEYLKKTTFRGKYDPTILREILITDECGFVLKTEKSSAQIGMFVSDLIRNKLVAENISFTMETVFSDTDKLNFMRKSIDSGYKVYLYFVATEDPRINVRRVEGRVAAGGHNVPHEKIMERYTRALNNLYDAVKLAYRAYIFDNSGEQTIRIAEKDKDGTLYLAESVPEWLIKSLRIA